jgi:beta-lactamase class D
MKSIKILIFLFIVSCSSARKPETIFEAKEGCFLLYNMKTDSFDKVIGEDFCKQSYPPFSTFKIPLAVMAFDSKVLRDENVVLKWDGVRDSREEVNRDHNAKTWMRDSVVWFSQRITPKLGKDKLQHYLNSFDYGDKDISEGLLTSWITPPSTGRGLKVTPYGQIEFLKKLWRNELPVSKRSMELTQQITFLETTPKGFKFSGKTGSNYFDKTRNIRMGWFIAHLQNETSEYVMVTNFKDLGPSSDLRPGGLRSKEITKSLLSELGLW